MGAGATMSRTLSRVEKERLTQFCGVTGAMPRVATVCLEVANWNIEAAVNYYYNSGISNQSDRSHARLDRCGTGPWARGTGTLHRQYQESDLKKRVDYCIGSQC